MYLTLGIIFLILIIAVAAGVCYLFARTLIVDKELISKKNLLYLIPTFLTVYCLLLVASVFNGTDINVFYCISLVNSTFDFLAFKIKLELISGLIAAYPIFYADFLLAAIVSYATIILSFASLFGLRLGNFARRARLFKRDCDIVIGLSESSLNYIKNNKNTVLWGVNVGKTEYDNLLRNGITVLRAKLNEKVLLKNLRKGEHHLIVFSDAQLQYTSLIGVFAAVKSRADNQLFLHMEVQTDEIKIVKEKFISKVDNSISAYITCFNYYELLARRFVYDYPISRYIPRSFYEQNFTLKSDKDINVVFVGFGKVNYRLFCMSAMQFQFVENVDGKLRSKPVHYRIFDGNEQALHNEYFSRFLYEFDEVFKNTDFPKPEIVCDLQTPEKLDVNSVEVKEKFRKLVNENSYTYFVVSLDDDYVDSAYAQTIKRLLVDETNYQIFVRTKRDGKKLNDSRDGIIYFGDISELYSRDSIVNEDLTELAMRINLMYSNTSQAAEWLKEADTPEEKSRILTQKLQNRENRIVMLEEWGKHKVIEQFSNLYHALNIQFKLGMMGLKAVKADDSECEAVSARAYGEKYVNPCMTDGYNSYSFYFKTYSSNVLAYEEHSRWNAFYILSDYTQMSKKEILARKNIDGNGAVTYTHKDAELKRHACLTTYEGLDELIRFKYEHMYPDSFAKGKLSDDDAKLLALGAIYRYDYMSLDSLYEELITLGFKITQA
ncbi:MAG: hypothetical protein NC332_05470 [Firmicutes bacterium]|nr:hypothetical protein [Bacillota bacterium]